MCYYRRGIVLSLLLLLFSSAILYSQPISMGQSIWNVPRTGGMNIAQPSPEAIAMRRYMDYPVSYASGTADISIPLLELPARGATVSLGLSYHTGGIKRDDKPTSVGLGWSLTGLGVISRQIKGYPDEWMGIDNPSGDVYDRYAVTFKLDPNSLDWRYLLKIYEGWHDTDYDIFSYSVPGYSGNFIILCDTIQKYPERVVRKIKPLPATNDIHFDLTYESDEYGNRYKFYITTPEGVRYEFTEAETVSTTTSTSPARLQEFANPDYEAQSVWYPTVINDNKTGEFVTVSYIHAGSWYNGGLHKCTAQRYNVYFDEYDGLYHTSYNYSDNIVRITSSSSCSNRMIPVMVSGRSGSIVFSIGSDSKANGYIKSIKLLDAEDKTVEIVNLDIDQTHEDGRVRLDGISIVKDNKIVDRYTFSYNPAVTGQGKDIFGYCNDDAYESVSVLDLSLKWTGRRPDFFGIRSASLKSITDISGVTTTLEYEPSTLNIRYGHQIFGKSIDIGMRLSSITTECGLTGRWRKRTFKYENPVCNIDLNELDYRDFLTQCGTHEIVRYDGIFKYLFGVIHTPSSTTRGCTLENAVIYYDRVTEELSGSNMDHPIHTIYEYALDQVIFPFFNASRTGTCNNSNATRNDRFQRIYMQYYSNTMVGFDSRPLDFLYSKGYFQEHPGASPLLKRRTDYEYVNGDYIPITEQRYYYSEANKEVFYNGGFCESTTMRYLRYGEEIELNVDCIGDMNYYFTTLYTSRFINDSTVTTHFFRDGSKRKIKNENLYRGSQLYSCPGFEYDTSRLDRTTLSDKPLGARVSSGDESIANFKISAWFSKNNKLRDAAYDRFTRSQPDVEKWVLKTAEGADSLHQRYDYRYSRNYMILLDKVTVEAGAPINGDTVIISRQKYSDYDNRWRVTEMVDAQGRRIRAKWMDKYDLLSEMSLPDAGLTTTYTHRPLVGCTSITSPSGRKRSFSYTAGRLTEERNTAGDLVASYAYQLYGDGSASAADRVNRFSTTLHDSSGSATDVTYYDGFGMPVQTVATVAGDNLVRSAVTYDALDRPVRQYLPVPADDDSYMKYVSSAAVRHYGDSHPFARMTYRNMAGDKPLEVIREGEKMQNHPERYEYLCNNTTDAMLRCRRYCLGASADSESITLDGDYPAGALDVTRATDPDGCTLLTFTDWRGLTMLERRVVSDTEFADTYYLYDILGNVRVILQPEGAAKMTSTTKTWTPADDIIDQYAFINRYDRRSNLTYAKVPGAGPVEMRYDPLNRLAFRQTATMAEQDESEFTLYAPIGRVAVTGIATVSPPNSGIPVMTATYAPGTVGRDSTGYTVPAPFYHINLRTTLVNYYDSYDFATRPGFSSLPADNMNMNASTAKGQVTGSRTAILDSDENNSRIYSIVDYDIEDRPLSRIESTVLADTYLHTAVGYTRQSHILSSELTLQRSDTIHVLRENNWLDALGNLMHLSVQTFRHNVDVTEYQKLVRSEYIEYYTYNALGQVVKAQNNLKRNNTTRYTYNHRGQITSITAPNFTQKLKYEDGEPPCFNGNISEMTVAYNGCTPIYRSFTYDLINRITSQTSTDHHDTSYSYNLNSCPLTISRFGPTSDGTIGNIDYLDLLYDGNRLTSVLDYTDPVLFENSMDFASFEASYNYDSDGRMIADTGRDVEIEYNEIGLPAGITIGLDGKLVYTYSANGRKIAEHYIRPFEGRTDSRYYIGPFEFISTEKKYPVISRINTRFGYFTGKGALMKTVADYQGNIRVVVDIDGNAVQTTDYYPYGLPMATSTGAAVNRYKYSGKELDTRNGLNFHDFEARMLFNDHTLFNRPDPHAGKYPHLNPYLYCAANPLRYIDPTGEDWIFNTMTSEYLWDKDVTSNNNLPENCRYIGQNINSVFSDLGIINGTITQHEPKVGITLSGNTSCGIPTGTSTDINSAIVLKPQIELMKDGSTLKFNGINVFWFNLTKII